MRRVALLLLLATAACQSVADAWTKVRGDAPPVTEPAPAAPAPDPAAPTTPSPVVAIAPPMDIAVVTASALQIDVEALASDVMAGRPTPSMELDGAAAFIAKRYERLSLEAPTDAPGHRQRFECGRPGAGESSNVVGILRGRASPDEFVMVSAHYDHIGTTDVGEDTIFNGANDDASGVAAMLAIAEVLSSLPKKPTRSVLFVAFCGEELGLRGSTYFAAHPLVPLASVVADLNLEMLGRPGTTAPKRVWMTGAPFSDLLATASAVGATTGIEYVDGAVVGPTEGHAFERSDNWPLAKAGIVAHSFSTGALDEYYHHVDDEPALLEYDRMVPLVQSLAMLTWQLAESDTTPQWNESGRAIGLGR